MNTIISIIRYEFKHFFRSYFKIATLILFLIAAVYGLQNGSELYKKQNSEIATIENQNSETKALVNSWFEQGKKGPEDKPWIDITTPTGAIGYASASVYKKPSPMMTFSIGQAEQFGYYKQLTNWSTTFDADLSEEIVNPERLAGGTLDFSFFILYLLPIMSIILLFNIGGLEKDLKFDKLIQINFSYPKKWLFARFAFYFTLILFVLLLLMIIYALITGALLHSLELFFKLYLLIVIYTFIWFAVFYFINLYGRGSSNQAIKMAAIWLLFCIVIPGSIDELASFKFPSNYMTDYTDKSRDKMYKMFDLPANSIKNKTLKLYPELSNTLYAKDTITDKSIFYSSINGLINPQLKQVAQNIEKSNERKNSFICDTYWINPISFFQNKMNNICETDYYAYKQYRSDIQLMIDKIINRLLTDSWNRETINKTKFIEYTEEFK